MPSDDPDTERKLHLLIVVPTTALLKQWKMALLRFFGEKISSDIAYYCGSRKDDPELPVMIYVVNSARSTLAQHIRRDLQHHERCLLIADECHRYTGPDNRRIFIGSSRNMKDPDYYTLGLSATPYAPPTARFSFPLSARLFTKTLFRTPCGMI